MFKEVREACTARHLVLGTNVVPNVNGYGGRRVIYRKDHVQTVWQFVAFERDVYGRVSGSVLLCMAQFHGTDAREGGTMRKILRLITIAPFDCFDYPERQACASIV